MNRHRSVQRHTSYNAEKTEFNVEETYLLCVEPGTQELFSINLGTQEAEPVSLMGTGLVENKIKREEYKI